LAVHSKRVTMQDIADACELSRNTVSKVFNGRGAVPFVTRERILQKAKELGYGQPMDSQSPDAQKTVGNIALLTRIIPGEAHFGTVFLSSFTNQISRAGYTLRIYEVSPEELAARRLPPHFTMDQIAGIVGIELFDRDYLDMVCRLGIPTVMTDYPMEAFSSLIECDYVMMENIAGISVLMKHLIAAGAKRFGFVGDSRHCGSFQERLVGFKMSLAAAGLQPDERLCIFDPDSSPYGDPDWLLSRIRQLPCLPDAFVCANDYLAIHVMMALKKGGYAIPDDVMVTGFDGTAQSAYTDPPLATVQIPGEEIGRMAANILLNRISDASFPHTWTRVKSTPVLRGSIRSAGGDASL